MKDADLYSLCFQSKTPKRVAYQRVDPAVLPADPVLDFPGGQMTVEAFGTNMVLREGSTSQGSKWGDDNLPGTRRTPANFSTISLSNR